MAWQNAPVLNKLTASQQGGNRGAQLWGVAYKGTLHTVYQKTPGGDWNGWHGPRWANAPDGMRKIAVTQMGGDLRALFLGLKDDGRVAACYYHHPSKWGRWRQDWEPTPQNSRFIEITACQQGDGRVAVWGLDSNRQLWGIGQKALNGDFGGWVGPNWLGAPRLRNIASVESKQGAIIFGQDEHYRMVANFQTAPGSNNWSGWSSGDWMNAPFSYELTAANQNNGCAQVWAVGLDQTLHSIAQTGPACGWEQSWNPRRKPPSDK